MNKACRICYSLLLGTILMWAVAVHAQNVEAPFDVRSAYIEPLEHGFALQATLDLGLSQQAEEAVRNGVPVKVTLDIQIMRKRHYFIDKKLEDRSISLTLKYDALSNRYMVSGFDGQNLGAFPELSEALAVMGHVDGVKVLEKESLSAKDDVEASVRANVSVESGSSTVMRYLMFWIDWRRSTDWYTWHVKL